MQSKAQRMKNIKATINVTRFLASVCKSDLVVINCSGPMARTAEKLVFRNEAKSALIGRTSR